MINNRFNVVYHLLGLVKLLFYKLKNINMKVGKKYQTGLSESHRPDLQPNGRVVECIEDKGNGYLLVKTDEDVEPNIWLVHEKDYTLLCSCADLLR